jgi:chromate transporter
MTDPASGKATVDAPNESDASATSGVGPSDGRPRSVLDLFVTFTLLALQGFGGVLPVAQRGLCEERRWLTRQEFVETLSISQLLPGPNICNVALIVGDRFFGARGAFASLAGLMAVPTALVLTLAALHAQWSDVPQLAGALRGVAIVAAGLVVGTALRLAGSLAPGPLGSAARLGLAIATFALIAILRVPLVWTLLGLGSVATAYAWYRLARPPAGDPRR